jgi:hypothetical protein
VSDRFLVYFDPHARFLPNVNPSNPGKMIDFMRHKQLVEQHSDQFTPFRAFGNTFAKAYKGTLFRLPLRTPELASVSRLTKSHHSAERMHALLTTFAQEASSMLLFLKNVEQLELYEWREGVRQPLSLCFLVLSRGKVVHFNGHPFVAALATHSPTPSCFAEAHLMAYAPHALASPPSAGGSAPPLLRGGGAGRGAGAAPVARLQQQSHQRGGSRQRRQHPGHT